MKITIQYDYAGAGQHLVTIDAEEGLSNAVLDEESDEYDRLCNAIDEVWNIGMGQGTENN